MFGDRGGRAMSKENFDTKKTFITLLFALFVLCVRVSGQTSTETQRLAQLKRDDLIVDLVQASSTQSFPVFISAEGSPDAGSIVDPAINPQLRRSSLLIVPTAGGAFAIFVAGQLQTSGGKLLVLSVKIHNESSTNRSLPISALRVRGDTADLELCAVGTHAAYCLGKTNPTDVRAAASATVTIPPAGTRVLTYVFISAMSSKSWRIAFDEALLSEINESTLTPFAPQHNPTPPWVEAKSSGTIVTLGAVAVKDEIVLDPIRAQFGTEPIAIFSNTLPVTKGQHPAIVATEGQWVYSQKTQPLAPNTGTEPILVPAWFAFKGAEGYFHFQYAGQITFTADLKPFVTKMSSSLAGIGVEFRTLFSAARGENCPAMGSKESIQSLASEIKAP
jgi:hypothetical protein